MKLRRLVAVALIVAFALLLLPLAGCAKLSPSQQAIVFSDGVTASAAVVRHAVETDAIKGKQTTAALEAVEAADAAATALMEAAAKGPLEWEAALSAANAAMNRLLTFRQQADRVRPVAKPTSDPTVRPMPQPAGDDPG